MLLQRFTSLSSALFLISPISGVNLAFIASHLLDWLKSYHQIHAPAHGAYNGEIGAHFLILLKNGGLI